MKQTPSFAQVLTDAMETRLSQLHTMMPGKVLAIDYAAGTADVQPLLQRQGIDGNPVTLPPITKCPIKWYRSGAVAIYVPISVGDTVELRFSERSLDNWFKQGDVTDPADQRKHQLSDAIVCPGLSDSTVPPTGADPKNIVLINGDSKTTLAPDGTTVIANENATTTLMPSGETTISSGNGTLTITASGKFTLQGESDELLQIIHDLLVKLQAVETPTMLGPQTFLPTDIADLLAIQERLDGLKG